MAKIWKYKNTIECPKSANFIPFIKNLAWELGLKLNLDFDETGWIFKQQHIRFEVNSEDESQVQMFVNRLCGAVEDYQSRVNSIY